MVLYVRFIINTHEGLKTVIEERLVELEIKLAYQEDLLQTLNSIVAKQQKQLSRMEETMLVLYDRMKSLAASAEQESADNQIPPHY